MSYARAYMDEAVALPWQVADRTTPGRNDSNNDDVFIGE